MQQVSPQPRPVIVDEVVSEASDVLSIWLHPRDGAPLPGFLPGQYLTLVWPDGLKRTYSLSATDADKRYRITVKLARDVQGALGRASARIAKLSAGDALDVERLRGNFHPDVGADTPLVLVSAGIGVTPVMSMIEHVTRHGGRNVLAAFGMRRPQEHPLMDELKALVAERRNLQVMIAYSQHDGEPVAGLPAPKFGRLTAADLLPHAAAPLAEVFLCGPGDFIRQMHDGLAAAGVNPLSIRYEAFGPSTLLPAKSGAPVDPAATFTVSFARSNLDVVWTPSSGTPLNLAEAAGVSPTFGCRAGSCGLCRTALSEGRVTYVEPIDQPEDGYVFPCRPADDVVLEVLVRHGLFGRAHAASDRNARGVHGFGVTGDERMPPIQVPALANEHVGAGRRQPIDGFEGFGRQPHAILDLFEPVGIVAAAAGLAVEQPAADIGIIGIRVVALFLELIEATSPAAVAKAFPFRISHFIQRLASPEWEIVRAIVRRCHAVLRAILHMPKLPPISIQPVITANMP